MTEAEIRIEADRIERKFGQWGEVTAFPLRDWRHQVTRDETRYGYWEWVVLQANAQGVKIF